jgi:hypothetical protein
MYYYEVPEAQVNVRRAKCREERAAATRTGPDTNAARPAGRDSSAVPRRNLNFNTDPSDQVQTDDGWEYETFE